MTHTTSFLSAGMADRRCDRLLSTQHGEGRVPDPALYAVRELMGSSGSSSRAASGTSAQPAQIAADVLRKDTDVFDAAVFEFCRSYVARHRQEHSRMSAEHTAIDERRVMQIRSFRVRWNAILNSGQSTKIGKIVTFIEGFMVLITIAATIIESFPKFQTDVNPDAESVWLIIEILTTLFFIIVTGIRMFVTPSWRALFKTPMTYVDIVSILPLFVQLAASSRTYGWLKTLRLTRLVKLLRVFQYVDALAETLRRIASSLIAPSLLLGVFVVVFGNIIYWLEGGWLWTSDQAASFISQHQLTNRTAVTRSDAWSLVNATVQTDCLCESSAGALYRDTVCLPKSTKFISAVQGMWYAAASFTTVGYGDLTPVCAPGKIITSFALLLSTIFIAMPIAIVGAVFAETVVDHHQKLILHKKLKATTIRSLRETSERKAQLERELKTQEARLERRAARHNNGSKKVKRTTALLLDQIAKTRAVLSSGSFIDSQQVWQGQRENSTPAAGLLRFIASQMRADHLHFGGLLHAVWVTQQPGVRRSIASTGCKNVTRASAAVGESMGSCWMGDTLMDAAEGYMAWLFDAWLINALDDRGPCTELLRRFTTGKTAIHGDGLLFSSNPFTRGDDMFLRSVRQKRKLELLVAARQELKAALQQRKLGNMHPLLTLQAVDRPAGFVKQAHLMGRCYTKVMSSPSAASSAAEVMGDVSMPSPQSPANPPSWIGGRSAPPPPTRVVVRTDMGNGASEPTILPADLGTLELSVQFASRRLVFIPHASAIGYASVNGVPLRDVAIKQRLLRYKALDREEEEEMVSQDSCKMPQWRDVFTRVVDIAEAISPTPLQDDTAVNRRIHDVSVYSALEGMAQQPFTARERLYSVVLRVGDVLEFSKPVSQAPSPSKQKSSHSRSVLPKARPRTLPMYQYQVVSI